MEREGERERDREHERERERETDRQTDKPRQTERVSNSNNIKFRNPTDPSDVGTRRGPTIKVKTNPGYCPYQQ